MMAAAREEGMDVLADTTPFVDGLGQLAGILPPWVGADGDARRRSSGCVTPETRKRLRTECDRYWRFIHKGEWDRVRLQASEQHPGLGRAHLRRDRRPAAQGRPWDCFFDVLADAGDALREHPRRRPALHRRAHGRDDLAPALLPRRRHVHRHRRRGRSPTSSGTRSATPATSTTSRTTCARTGTLRLEEAIRKMTSMPAAHFGLWDRGLLRAGLRRRRRRLRLRRARRGLDGRRPAPLRARRRARARQRRARRRRRRAHRRPTGTAPAARAE